MGVRGQGDRIGEATTDANEVLLALNPRSETVRADWRSFKGFSDSYAAAADDIVATLDAASTTSTTVTDNAAALDALLLNTIGFGRAGVRPIGPQPKELDRCDQHPRAHHGVAAEVQPRVHLPACRRQVVLGQRGHSGSRRQRQDIHPGRGDSCWAAIPTSTRTICPSSRPRAARAESRAAGRCPMPARTFLCGQLVTNTGWGTGLDYRPNPGIGIPAGLTTFR